jgi:hypothetical protein
MDPLDPSHSTNYQPSQGPNIFCFIAGRPATGDVEIGTLGAVGVVYCEACTGGARVALGCAVEEEVVGALGGWSEFAGEFG